MRARTSAIEQLRWRTSARRARSAKRGSPCRRWRWRSRPATGAMFTRGAAFAVAGGGEGGQPACRGSRGRLGKREADARGHFESHDAVRGDGPRARHAGPQVAAVEVVAHCEQAGALTGAQVRYLPPSVRCQHRAVMGLHVADHRQRARAADVVQRSVDYRQPILFRQPLGDVGLGVAPPPQAFAAGVRLVSGNGVRLPTPASRLRRQFHPLPGGKDRRPADRDPVEVQRPVAVNPGQRRLPRSRRCRLPCLARRCG